jgi:hypothetical protein
MLYSDYTKRFDLALSTRVIKSSVTLFLANGLIVNGLIGENDISSPNFPGFTSLSVTRGGFTSTVALTFMMSERGTFSSSP